MTTTGKRELRFVVRTAMGTDRKHPEMSCCSDSLQAGRGERLQQVWHPHACGLWRSGRGHSNSLVASRRVGLQLAVTGEKE